MKRFRRPRRCRRLGIALAAVLALVPSASGDAVGGSRRDGTAGAPVGALPCAPTGEATAAVAIDEPVRDLVEVERLETAIAATGAALCRVLADPDPARAADLAAPGARPGRLLPRRVESWLAAPAGVAEVLHSPAQPCAGDAAAFATDLLAWSAEWRALERCQVVPTAIFAQRREAASAPPEAASAPPEAAAAADFEAAGAPESVTDLESVGAGPGPEPRLARVELAYSLGGVRAAGGRACERGSWSVVFAEGEDGVWRFLHLEPRPAEVFTATAPAFADRTERAGLPTDWVDVGYDPRDVGDGQVLHGGVTAADYDGDGDVDLYVPRAGPNLLLRNDGSGGFEDVAPAAGVDDPGNGQAALLADLDNDGDPDLVVVNGFYRRIEGPHVRRPHGVYENQGDGRFRLAAELGPVGPTAGVTAADYDGDGLLDLYVLYYQDQDIHPYHHPVEARDGELNRLFRNRGGFRFEDVTERAGVGGAGWTYAAAWADYDGDGAVDLYVANDFGDNHLYRNLGDGTFHDVAPEHGALDPANGMSAEWADYDNDGRLDVYVSNMESPIGRRFLLLDEELGDAVRGKLLHAAAGSSLYRQGEDGTFREVGRELGVGGAGWAWGANFLDVDNDGWQDLHVANGFWAGPQEADAESLFWRRMLALTPPESGVAFDRREALARVMERLPRSDLQVLTSPELFRGYSFRARERNLLFANAGGRRFFEMGYPAGVDLDLEGRGVAVADLDGDGGLDLVVRSVARRKLVYLHNELPRRGTFLRLDLEGRESNRDAIGATVRVEAGGFVQTRVVMAGSGYQSQSEGTLHFGLGTAERVDRLEVRWPSGRVDVLHGVPAGRRLLVEGESPVPAGRSAGAVNGPGSAGPQTVGADAGTGAAVQEAGR